MAILALTMGPHLGIIMVPTVLSIGSAGTITFKAVGANGNVRWKLISSNLPDEWDASLNVSGGQATLETDEIEVPGTFTVTVQCTDESRVPVVRTFVVRVMALPLTISGSFPEWEVGVPATGALTISGGIPPYSGLEITSGALPFGVSLSIVGNQIVASGTPTADGAWEATLQVSDAVATPAQISVSGDVVEGVQSSWSATNKASDIVLSNNGADAESVANSNNGGSVVSATGHSTGKYYIECIHVQTRTAWQSVGFGLMRGINDISSYAGATSNGWAVWVDGTGGALGATYTNGVASNSANVGFSVPRTARMAVDLDSGKVWFSRFGQTTWIGGGDPALGTSPTYTFTPGATFYFCGTPRGGDPADPAQRNKLRIAAPGDWAYSAPGGFGVWV